MVMNSMENITVMNSMENITEKVLLMKYLCLEYP